MLPPFSPTMRDFSKAWCVNIFFFGQILCNRCFFPSSWGFQLSCAGGIYFLLFYATPNFDGWNSLSFSGSLNTFQNTDSIFPLYSSTIRIYPRVLPPLPAFLPLSDFCNHQSFTTKHFSTTHPPVSFTGLFRKP